jgi:putative aldouronate transport system substrate-binding protein
MMKRMKRTLCVLAALTLIAGGSAWAQLSAPGVFPISKNKVNVTLIADTRTHIDDYAKVEVVQYLEKLTNVHVNWKTLPSSVEAVSLSLASGEDADGYWTSNAGIGITSDQLEQYGVQEKMFMPLDALIEKDMPNYKKAIAAVPNGVGLTKSTDGKIYALPQIDYCQHCEHSAKMWINQTWLDKLGLKTPTTTDEFYAMLKAFKTKDPNGNGKADEIGMIGAITNSWQQYAEMFILNSFVYYDPNLPVLGYYVDKGTVTSSLKLPAYKEGLKYMTRLYKEGLIYEGSFTQDADVVKKIVESGDVPVVGAAPAGYTGMFVAKIGDERSRDFRPISPLKGPNGFRNAPFESWPISVGHLVINSKSKNAEVLLKWADFFYSLEGTLYNRYGMRGKGWDLVKAGSTEKDYNGNPAVWKQLREWDPNTFINESFFDTGVWNMDVNFRPSCASPQGLDLWSAEGNEQQLYLTTKNLYKPYAHNEMALPPLKFTPAESLDVAALRTELQKYMQKTQFDFITGAANIDTDWSKYLDGLEKAGVSRLQAAYQKAYERQIGKK